jgi:hypothetical protein
MNRADRSFPSLKVKVQSGARKTGICVEPKEYLKVFISTIQYCKENGYRDITRLLSVCRIKEVRHGELNVSKCPRE